MKNLNTSKLPIFSSFWHILRKSLIFKIKSAKFVQNFRFGVCERCERRRSREPPLPPWLEPLDPLAVSTPPYLLGGGSG